MERVEFQLFASSACFPVAWELRQILVRQGFSLPQLTILESEELPHASLQMSPFIIMVYNDPSLLAQSVAFLRKLFSQAVFLFVNIFPPSTPPLDLLSAGFDDFLPFPFDPASICAKIRTNRTRSHVPRHTETDLAKHMLKIEVGLSDLVGTGPSFTRVLQQIVTLARTDATVLILGETGTGKDLCARAIHYTGPRAGKAFLPVNCGGIPDDLFENEFFGHERGAYTDAREKFAGLIHEAEGGTILLDDIESLSLKNQAKLLRFIEATEYLPLGSTKLQRSNVRVIASTNTDLFGHVRRGLFREDLYFRLAVLTLIIPPLRNRPEDIPVLAEHFIRHYAALYGRTAALSSTALKSLLAHPWPGNVRELQNVIHRTVVQASAHVIEEIDFNSESTVAATDPLHFGLSSFNEAKKEFVNRFEQEYIEHLLRDCGGNVSEAARRAGKHRRAFWEIMRKHNISRNTR